jgi:hypothetical protein
MLAPPSNRNETPATEQAASLWQFWLPLLGFLGLRFLVRVLSPDELDMDQAEQLVLAQSLAWGYDAQSPLYTWLVWVSTRALGPSVAALGLVQNLIFAVFFGFLFASARRLTGSVRVSAVAAFSMLLIPSVPLGILGGFTHTVLANAAVAASFYCLMRLREAGSWTWHLLLGLALGLGTLSKLNYLVAAAAMFLAGLALPGLRSRICSGRMIFALVIGLLLIVPHFLWMLNHSEELYEHVSRRGRLESTADYFDGVLRGTGFVARRLFDLIGRMLLAMACFFPMGLLRPIADLSEQDDSRRFLRWYFTLGILAMLAVVGCGFTVVERHWMQPFVLWVPLGYLLRRPATSWPRWSFGGIRLCLLIYAMLMMIGLHGPGWINRRAPLEGRRPFACWEAHASRLVAAGYRGEPILAGDESIAGNLRLCFPAAAVLSARKVVFTPPGATQDSAWLVVWNPDEHRGGPLLSERVRRRLGRPLPPASEVYRSELSTVTSTFSTPRLCYCWMTPEAVDTLTQDENGH